MPNKILNFDMDGTIADLYGVPNWLEQLRNFSIAPYELARPLVPMEALSRHLNRLQANGYCLRIISWTSKESTPEYDAAIVQAKCSWLKRHLPSVIWDEILIVPYGTPKHTLGVIPGGILFDDSVPVRRAWGEGAYDEMHMMQILRSL